MKLSRWARPLAGPLAVLLTACSAAAQAAETQPLHLVRGVISSESERNGDSVPVEAFLAEDKIYLFTEVTWDQPELPAGTHELLYNWYTGDKLTFTFGGKQSFDSLPRYWNAHVSGSHLGVGRHRAELLVDGKRFDSREFEIVPGVRNGDIALRDRIKQEGLALLMRGDTEGFDRLADHYRSTQERTPSGLWKLALLYNCLDLRTFRKPQDETWSRLEESFKQWINQKPDSPAAVLMLAALHHGRAWAYRGHGYANEVKPESWAPYRRYIRMELRLLEAHRALAARDPEWDAMRLEIAKEQGENEQTLLDMANAALDREAYYTPTHYAAATALIPKWGGSPDQARRYLDLALQHTREREGTQMYARIYSNIARTSAKPLDALNGSGAHWPAMKQSMDELLRAYPDASNYNTARAFACLAGVKDYYIALGHRGPMDAEQITSWDSLRWRKNCDDWAFEGVVTSKSSTPEEQVENYLSFLAGMGENYWTRTAQLGAAALLVLELTMLWLGLRPGVPPGPAFNPALYPRSYRPQSVWRLLADVFAVAALSGGGALAAAIVSAIRGWDNLQEHIAALSLSVAPALLGAIWMIHRLNGRLVLRADAVELHGMFSNERLPRAAIAGVRRKRRLGRNVLLVETAAPARQTVRVRDHADVAFQQWFGTLPDLAAGDQ